ncbi:MULTISPECIES: ABC transporter substrate-binding protein [Streptomyces]|uniref:Extracellular solute-binding protein n=1 Tax=Streptomyces caniscabiei TaxID=2746961 RepID=A0ABU4MPE5_9ACTN|nr:MULTISPECIES: extracellular solute-binding protein [Streptomyces]MBE4735835.1 extracellular solute-binding protein [Streptomyces caniscabiei]MBE4762597.1 extracellular solute-binding protein [Streptomyces caniscabiei]MBE4774196.1 extracellular solute-binding protein [Streptomyces caniscabiei]MBE4788543.1 extracellular solute-binding protein [Streptomyces caniscabiei]MBE4796251.1 extracellular solute-binding protein [Streptomyces caniscabiei]
MKTRALPTLALICALGLAATACSDPTAGASGADSDTGRTAVDPTARLDGVKLTMWTAQNTVGAPRQVIDAFEKATGAEVETQAIPDPYESNVPTKLASGDRPDLMFWQPSVSTLPFVQPQQNLLTLDGEKWVSRLGDTEKSLGVIDGKRYAAVVTSPAMLGVYYNKDVFKKAGIAEKDFPKSYDELLALGHRVVDDTDAAAFYEAGGDKWPLQWQMQVQLTDLDQQWWADLNANKEKWTDPVVVGAIKKYKEKLLDAGLAQKNYRTGTFTGQADALWKGEAGMVLNVTSFQSQLQAKYSTAEIDQRIGWFPVANSAATGLYSPDQTNGVVAFRTGDEKRQNAARQFLAFWLGPDYPDYIKAMKIPSVQPSVPTPDGLPEASKAQVAALPTAIGVFQAKAIVAPDAHLYLADMLFDKKSPQQVAQAIQDQFAQVAKAQGAPGF